MLDNQHSNEDQSRINRLVELIWNDQRVRIQSGQFIRAEEYLEQFPEISADIETSVDIIYNEYLLRSELGFIDETEYYHRFPQFAMQLKRQIRLSQGINASAKNESSRTTESQGDETVDSAIKISNSKAPGAIRYIGDYELGPEIGRGAFAIVYKAWDPRLSRQLAIKIPRDELLEAPHTRKRMLREARSAAQLYHPSIVAVHEIGEHDGTPFIVSDFIDGQTMEMQLRQNAPTTDVAANWVLSIADAVHYAHQNGIIHRDIKPANILIREDGQLLLTDFGLAQLADSAGSITRLGDILGTPAYMSPEQASGLAVDLRTDIYSLGIVLHRCLTGSLPFEGPVSSILHRIVHEPIEGLSMKPGSVPRDLETITLKCLCSDPSERYQTARDLADDLERYLAGEPISARPVGITEKLVKQVRRRPRTAALVVATLILSGFVAGGAFQLGNVMQQRDRAQDAERQAHSLAASAEFDAGLLAKQQGRIQSAIKKFDQSLQSGFDDPVLAHLEIAECNLISGQVKEARFHLDEATQKDKSHKRKSEIAYWECELALLDESYESVIDLISSVPLSEIELDQREFLLGMRAEHSLEALKHFQSAVEDNPYHHSAMRSRLIMSFALAQFDDVLREVQISQRLYPEDDDFVLLEALATAASGDSGQATLIIDRTQLDDQEKSDWAGFCQTIEYVTTKLNNEATTEQINLNVIKGFANEFQANHLPLIKKRRWHFPPRIAKLFVDIPGFSIGLNNQIVATSLPSTREQAIKLAQSHPEASLFTLAARTCLDQLRAETREDEISELEEARDLFMQSADYPGFLADAQHHGKIGVFATAVKLALIHKHEVEKNTTMYVDAVSAIDPQLIDQPSRLRTITLSLINANEWEKAETWAKRWADAPKENKQQQVTALWHVGIVLEHQQRWLDLVKVCDKILKLDAEMQLAKDFRNGAIFQLQKLTPNKESDDDKK